MTETWNPLNPILTNQVANDIPDIEENFDYLMAMNGYWVDSSEADQGAAGSGNSIKDLVDAIGSTKNATLFLKHHAADGNTTTYTLTTSETIPSNITVICQSGVRLDGVGTLTINGPFRAGLYQVFGTSITVIFAAGMTVETVWFGLNGTTDQTAINLAIDSVTTNGGAVHHQGAAAITAQIDLATGVHLFGDGFSSLIEKTNADNEDVISCDGIHNFEISGLRIKNSSQVSGESAYGIRITNGSYDGSVHHNWVEDSWIGIGVLDPGPADEESYRMDIHHNYVYDIGENGITCNVITDGKGVAIDHNHIYAFGTGTTTPTVCAGIELRGAKISSVSNNIIYNATTDVGNYTADGIRIEYATEGATSQPEDSVFNNNVIYDVSGHGFRVQYAKGCVISGNTLRDVDGYGIVVLGNLAATKYSSFNTIFGNSISTCTQGIRLESDSADYPPQENIITGNNITLCTNGIAVYLSNDNQFSNNLITFSTGIGILHASGLRNSFSNDTVINGNAAGIAVTLGTQVMFFNCKSYATETPNVQTYGLTIAAGAVNTIVDGGIYTPNLTGTIQDSSSESTIYKNVLLSLTAGQGVSRTVVDGWYQDNAAASQTDVALTRNSGAACYADAWIAPKAGYVTAMNVTSNAARTAGTLTVELYKNNGDQSIDAALDGTNTTSDTTLINLGAVTFAKGDYIEIKVTTDAGWLPVTADIRCSIEVEM